MILSARDAWRRLHDANKSSARASWLKINQVEISPGGRETKILTVRKRELFMYTETRDEKVAEVSLIVREVYSREPRTLGNISSS